MRRAAVFGGIGIGIAVGMGAMLRCGGHPEPSHVATRTAVLPLRATRVDPEVTPPPAGSLRLEGLVLDDEEHVVAGARVVLIGRGRATTSGDDGSFVFEKLGAARYGIAAARSDAFAGTADIDLRESNEPVIVRLLPTTATTVRVIDADSRAAIANAELRSFRCPPMWACRPGDIRPRTDAAGTAVLRGLPAGSSLALEVSADGFEPTQLQRWPQDVGVPFGELTIELHRGVPIGGVVLGPGDEPVPDAEVIVTSEHGEQRTKSDASGHWQFRVLAGGPHRFRALADGFKARSADEGEVELDGRSRTDVVVRVDATVAISGIVVDEAGQPVAGATVTGCPRATSDPITTDAGGRFRVGCWPSETFQFTAWKGPLRSSTIDVAADAHPPIDLRLVVATSAIAGTVVDSRGAPVPNAWVRVDHYGGERSDLHGHFEVGLEPGTYRLAAERSGQVMRDEALAWVDATTGMHDVKLVARDVATLSGRLLLDGKPITDFGLDVAAPGDSMHQYISVHAPDGRFSRSGLVAGTWRATFVGRGFARTIVDGVVVTAGHDKDLGDIAAEHGAQLRGRVIDTRGAPVPGAKVTLHAEPRFEFRDAIDRATEGTVATLSDPTGAFLLTGLTAPIAGTHVVAEHATLGNSSEHLVGEHETSIDLVIAATGGIEGWLAGGNQGNYFVTVSPVSDPELELPAMLDRVDRFRLDGLAPGEYVVRLPFTGVLPVRVHVAAGQRAQARLAMPRTTIVFVVHGPTCTRLRLELGDTHDLVQQQDCDEPVFHVPPGAYRVCIDDRPCRPVVVAPEPAEQAIDIQ